jgi:hypothetical protein
MIQSDDGGGVVLKIGDYGIKTVMCFLLRNEGGVEVI